MPARKPRVGRRYQTCSGLPVQVVVLSARTVTLQSLVSDNRLAVPADFPLEPLKRGDGALDIRADPYQGPRAKRRRGRPQPKPLAPAIDALLLEGGRTMRGLVREVKRRASAACRGKDVPANVRARLYWFKRKGYRADSNGQAHLRVLPPPRLGQGA